MLRTNIYNTTIYDNFQRFYKSASAGGVLLIIAAFVSTIWANSPWGEFYHHIWENELSFSFGGFKYGHTLHHWINDGLMVVFFFMVGLEIKREMLVGELSSIKKSLLPILGALGGMIVPALIFTIFNNGHSETIRGWAIPMATDIAFALGILSLLGNKVPLGLKVFLAALAIVDDIGAVLVIAIFYTSSISVVALAWAGFFLFLLFVANRLQINYPLIYLLIGIGLWFAFMASGVHSTIAGVLSAFMIPASSVIDKRTFKEKVQHYWNEFKHLDKENENERHLTEHQHETLHHISELSIKVQPPLQRLEHGLQKWVGLIIMPIFALVNCGVDLSTFRFENLLHPITFGVASGLLFGKIIGVFSIVYFAIKMGYATMPDNVNMKQIFGVSILCAIGFTMSLFVSNLAYGNGSEFENNSKIGILLASLIAGLIGYWFLDRTIPPLKDEE